MACWRKGEWKALSREKARKYLRNGVHKVREK